MIVRVGFILATLTFPVNCFNIPCWSSSFSMFDCCKLKTDRHKQGKLLNEKFVYDVFGQHIAQDKIGRMIFSHAMNNHPSKALVMSFHGWTGNGKNFVAKQIADTLYLEGMKNRNVHMFFSSLHFPKEDQVDIYKIHLIDWIRGNVSICDRSMFIFDEVDKMPTGLLDAIKPFMDYHVEIDGFDYRKSIFLLLSNTGGHNITLKSLELWKEGRKREEFRYNDFEKLIQIGAFNEQGGLFRADIVHRSLVDLYVPFLPMEKDHVKQCAAAEYRRRGYSWKSEDLETISDSIEYWPPDIKLYSVTGCKRIYQLVAAKIHEGEMDWLSHDILKNEL